jgi:hypothetical protein
MGDDLLQKVCSSIDDLPPEQNLELSAIWATVIGALRTLAAI